MQIDVTRVRVESVDFVRAMRNLTPAQQVGCAIHPAVMLRPILVFVVTVSFPPFPVDQRSVTTPTRKLNEVIKPLLSRQLAELLQEVAELVPTAFRFRRNVLNWFAISCHDVLLRTRSRFKPPFLPLALFSSRP